MPDPVHWLGSAAPQFAAAEVVRYFKGIPSRGFRQEFVALRRQDWGENAALWVEGCQVGTAGHLSAETIQRQIEQCQPA